MINSNKIAYRVTPQINQYVHRDISVVIELAAWGLFFHIVVVR